MNKRQTPAILLAAAGAYLGYVEITHYDSGPDHLGVLPQIGLIVSLLLSGAAIAIAVRNFQRGTPRLPMAVLVGSLISYCVKISDEFFSYQHRALYLWSVPLSGIVAAGIVWYLLLEANTIREAWRSQTPIQWR